MIAAWEDLNAGPEAVERVALGSPHFSLSECEHLAGALNGRRRHPETQVIVTAGHAVIRQARASGALDRLQTSGLQVLPGHLLVLDIRSRLSAADPRADDQFRQICPLRSGLSGRAVRLGTMADCVEAALTGRVPPRLPKWTA